MGDEKFELHGVSIADFTSLTGLVEAVVGQVGIYVGNQVGAPLTTNNIGDYSTDSTNHAAYVCLGANVWVSLVSPGTAGFRTTEVAASSAIAATETLIAKNITVVPGVTLRVGSKISATIFGTCTSGNADVATFTLYGGNVGTVGSDTAIVSPAVTSAGSGTAVAFKATLDVIVRTIGATGTAAGSLTVENTGITGLTGVTNTTIPVTGTSLNFATWNILSLSFVTAASTTAATFQVVDFVVTP